MKKNRSGSIVHRIVRKIAADKTDSLGGTLTLSDTSVVTDVLAYRVRSY